MMNVDAKFGPLKAYVPDATIASQASKGPIAPRAPKGRKPASQPHALSKPIPMKKRRVLADATNSQIGMTNPNVIKQVIEPAGQMRKPIAKLQPVIGVVAKAQPKLQGDEKWQDKCLLLLNSMKFEQRQSISEVKRTIDQFKAIEELTQAHNKETAKLKQEIGMHSIERLKAEQFFQSAQGVHAKEIDELKKQINEERQRMNVMETRYKGELAEVRMQRQKVMTQNEHLVKKMRKDVDAIKVKKLQMKQEFDNKYAQIIDHIARQKNQCGGCGKAIELQRSCGSQCEKMM